MIHPDTILRATREGIGLGVFATRAIAWGTLTWVRDELDQVLTPARADALRRRFGDVLDKYTHRDAADNHVLCWDAGRFVNHSCDANCLTTPEGFDVAVRDIAAGEELTNDYALLNLLPAETFRCLCGLPTCRGTVAATDRAALGDVWQAKIAQARARLGAVSQPLAFLMQDPL